VKISIGDVGVGFLKGMNTQLKDSLEETRELSRSAKERAMAKDDIAWQEYSKNKKEVEIAVEDLASIAKQQNVPLAEGQTYYDYAGLLFSKAGNVANATQLAADVREGMRLNMPLDNLITEVDARSKGLGFTDVVNQLVRRPTRATKPIGTVKGMGLLSHVDITSQIEEAMNIQSSIPDAPSEKVDFGTADIQYGKLKAAKDYEQEQEMYKIQKQAAINGNLESAARLKELGVIFDSADLRNTYTRLRDAKLLEAGYGIDPETNRPRAITTLNDKKAAFASYQEGLRQATQTGQVNGSLQGDSNKVKRNKEQIILIANETLAFIQANDINQPAGEQQVMPYVKDNPENVIGQLYRMKDGSIVVHLGDTSMVVSTAKGS